MNLQHVRICIDVGILKRDMCSHPCTSSSQSCEPTQLVLYSQPACCKKQAVRSSATTGGSFTEDESRSNTGTRTSERKTHTTPRKCLVKGEEQAMEFIQRNNDRCRGTYVLITTRLSHSHLRRRPPPSRVGAPRSPLAIQDRACHQFTQHSCRPFQPSSTRSSASACSVRARPASPLSQLSARGGGTVLTWITRASTTSCCAAWPVSVYDTLGAGCMSVVRISKHHAVLLLVAAQ